MKTKIQTTQKLSVFLCQPSVTTIADAIRTSAKCLSYPLAAPIGPDGMIFVQSDRTKEPRWLAFLRSGAASSIPNLLSASNAALLVLKVDGRIFAISFGYGRVLLDESRIERQFGLKVALGAMDPKLIRSVDAKTVDELTVNTRRQASKAADFHVFGIEVDRDLLRAATGTSINPVLGKHLTGTDALMVSRPVCFSDIPVICREALAILASGAYRKDFEFIDFLSQVRDKAKIAALDAALEAEIQASGTSAALHMGPPETIDWTDVEGFSFTKRQKNVLEELNVVDLLMTFRTPAEATITNLKHRRVTVVASDGARRELWRVYDCIVFERQESDGLYVLSGGDWFKADTGFVNRVTTSVSGRLCSSVLLPPCNRGETETEYSKRLGLTSAFACMDRRLVKPTGARTAIEVCDLVTPSKQIIHLKPKTESGTLSYVFTQGMVSAEALLGDDGFRRGAASQLKTASPSFPSVFSKPFNAGDFEVVFGIIAPKRPNFPNSLPFFGQLAFYNTAKRLQTLGFSTSILQVEKL